MDGGSNIYHTAEDCNSFSNHTGCTLLLHCRMNEGVSKGIDRFDYLPNTIFLLMILFVNVLQVLIYKILQMCYSKFFLKKHILIIVFNYFYGVDSILKLRAHFHINVH